MGRRAPWDLGPWTLAVQIPGGAKPSVKEMVVAMDKKQESSVIMRSSHHEPPEMGDPIESCALGLPFKALVR